MKWFQWRKKIAAPPVIALAAPEPPTHIAIDRFVVLIGFVHLRGTVQHPRQSISRLHLGVAGALYEVPLSGADFNLRLDLGDGFEMVQPTLTVTYIDGTQVTFENLGQSESHSGRGHQLFPVFLQKVAAHPSGNFLEIGSRARSGVTRRELIPAGWNYTGFDIMPGENVDIVGDAHSLSTQVPHNHFQAVMAVAVFEHILMPWQVALEMNKVMTMGGIAFIFTHQSFPLHDEPWDYLRFSANAWPGFFNDKTGFRILEAAAAEPVYMVGQRWNPGVNHRLLPGMTVSSVLVQKIADSDLLWPVDASAIVKTSYPA
jgi:hypothetical protein